MCCILYIEVCFARPLWDRVFYPFSLFIIYYLIISVHKFVLLVLLFSRHDMCNAEYFHKILCSL